MCPKLSELLSWNGPTVHVCCFILSRASTKTFVSRVKKQRKNLRYPKNSLTESLVSRGITVYESRLKYVYTAYVFFNCNKNSLRLIVLLFNGFST